MPGVEDKMLQIGWDSSGDDHTGAHELAVLLQPAGQVDPGIIPGSEADDRTRVFLTGQL
jgi:hypothetical protein